MSVEEGLLQEICTNPDDVAPRLVYADWLEERGDPPSLVRAEFIRVQVELGNNNMGPNGVGAVADADPGLGRLTSLALDDNNLRDPGVEILAGSELLGRLTDLNLEGNDITLAGVRALAASPRCANLLRLSLTRNRGLGADAARAPLTSPPLAGLRRRPAAGAEAGLFL
jgi:uncharacterized protein (TIGR02996 family)